MRPSASAGLAVFLGCQIGVSFAAPPGTRAADSPAPVRVGILEASTPSAGTLAAGAREAVAELNAEGGINGRPLELLTLSPGKPWKNGATLMARLIFAQGIVALIGPTDGAGAHVAAQIATRRRLPLVTLSPEETLTRAMDPWVFRGVPEDGAQARALLRWAFPDPRGKSAVLVIPPGRDGRERFTSLQDACRDLGVNVTAVIHAGAHASSVESAEALLLWLDPKDALGFLAQWITGQGRYRILGSTRLDDREFLAHAPSRATGLALPLLRTNAVETTADAPLTNAQPVRASGAGLGAVLGYDMVQAIAAAARQSGSDPGSIRRGLAQGSSLMGRSGTFHFDQRGNRQGAILIGVLRHGELVPAPSNPGGLSRTTFHDNPHRRPSS